MRIACIMAMILVVGVAAGSTRAEAAESVVLSAAALKTALAERPPEGFEPGDSDKPTTFGTVGEMVKSAVAGVPFDVIILPPDDLADLARRGLVDPRSIHLLGTMRLAAAVRQGAHHPPINTEAAFREALVESGSIAMADPGNGAMSGTYLARLFDRLGLSADLRAKVKLYPDGQTAMEAVAHGDADLAIGQMSEAAPVLGIDIIGLLPDALQLKTVYAAAIAAHPVDRGLAERTMTRLSGQSFLDILRRQGFTAAK